MKPTIGRIVIYHCENAQESRENNNSDVAPAVIVHVWGDAMVNLKVLTDGMFDIWKTSVAEGTGPRQWSWPERV